MSATPLQNTAAESPTMDRRALLLVIIGLMSGMFLASLDQMVFSTAIRTIGDSLHGLDLQVWVTTGYLISSTVSTPIFGKLSDVFGRRMLYIIAIVLFVAGSMLGTLANDMLTLAAFRAIQGLGAGGLMSLPLAIMGDVLAPRERAKYQGFFLAVFGISSVLGPLVGGLLAGTPQILGLTGWRWIFFMNVPTGILALVLVLKFLHLPRYPKTHKHRIDWWGALFIITALTPLLLVAEQGREWGWLSAASITCYVIGGISIILFIFAEKRIGADALLPLHTFRSGSFTMSSAISFLVGFALFGAMMTIPLYLQVVLGLTPTESGFATLPMMFGLLSASAVAGLITSRTGKYGFFLATGTFTTAAGMYILTTVSYNSPLWIDLVGLLVVGLGFGQIMQTLTIAMQNSVAARDIGVATSAATFFREIGGTAGVAILLSVLFAQIPVNVTHQMGNVDNLRPALNAALDPDVANRAENKKVMSDVWAPITDNLRKAAAANPQMPLDLNNPAMRNAYLDQATDKIAEGIRENDKKSEQSEVKTNDTSFLNGADDRLTAPFKKGFTTSIIVIYWIVIGVLLFTLLLTIVFRAPKLRETSALAEAMAESKDA